MNLSACGKVPHVVLVSWNRFGEGVCGCSAGALQIWLPKGRNLMLERFKMDPAGYQKHGANRVPK